MSDAYMIEGEVVSVVANKTKAGNDWAEVHVLVPEEYNGEDRSSQVPLKVFGKLAPAALALEAGDGVAIPVKVRGSYWEKGERWFVDLVVLAIHADEMHSTRPVIAPPSDIEDDDGLPF